MRSMRVETSLWADPNVMRATRGTKEVDSSSHLAPSPNPTCALCYNAWGIVNHIGDKPRRCRWKTIDVHNQGRESLLILLD